MSHNIRYATYSETVDRRAVQQEWDQVARKEGAGEGCSGLGQQIRWYPDPVCESYDDAKIFVSSHDRGWYDQLAVRYREMGKPTKEIEKMREALNQARQKYMTLNGAFHFADAKAAYIGCKSCGSKLSRPHLKTNFCPLCRADLRPDSTKAALQRQADKIKGLEKKLEEAEKEAAKKNGKIKWLVKVEYHT